MPITRSNYAARLIAKHTARATAKSAEAIFRWAATDHSNIGQALQNNPYTNPADRAGYVASIFGFALGGVILQAIWIFLLFAYVIPFLLTLAFM